MESTVLERTTNKKGRVKVRRPKWSVTIKDNDYTPINVVVAALVKIFNYSPENAFDKAKEAMDKKEAVVVTTSKEMAESLYKLATTFSQTYDSGRLEFGLKEEN